MKIENPTYTMAEIDKLRDKILLHGENVDLSVHSFLGHEKVAALKYEDCIMTFGNWSSSIYREIDEYFVPIYSYLCGIGCYPRFLNSIKA